MRYRRLLPMIDYDKPYTRIVVQNQYGDYELTIQRDGLTSFEFVDELVKPMMLAVGYQQSSVEEALGECEDSIPNSLETEFKALKAEVMAIRNAQKSSDHDSSFPRYINGGYHEA